jgi:hypothetical protein
MVNQLSEKGLQAIDVAARQHAFSRGAVMHMHEALMHGNARMAQFSHPEFGGAGQWMTGGMTMIGDMFNDQLKARIDRLCHELRGLQADAGNFVAETPDVRKHHTGWWPPDLGMPTSSGAQNEMRYAYFAAAQRLVVDASGKVTIYDTRGHAINGFSQQQSTTGSMTFDTGAGAVGLNQLPVVSSTKGGDVLATPAGDTSNSASNDYVFASIEKLADLRAKGAVSLEEFERKKKELLDRL